MGVAFEPRLCDNPGARKDFVIAAADAVFGDGKVEESELYDELFSATAGMLNDIKLCHDRQSVGVRWELRYFVNETKFNLPRLALAHGVPQARVEELRGEINNVLDYQLNEAMDDLDILQTRREFLTSLNLLSSLFFVSEATVVGGGTYVLIQELREAFSWKQLLGGSAGIVLLGALFGYTILGGMFDLVREDAETVRISRWRSS